MNIFSIGDGGEYDLTRENFIEKTHKKYPFFRDSQKNKTPYFAICPACGNPIQIINLFGVQKQEEHTGKTNLHGRHYKSSVKDLADYSEEKYVNCILHSPNCFRLKEIRKDEGINNYIREIIETNKKKICADIRKITGVLLTDVKLNAIIDDYIRARAYCYEHTNKYNIPYSILYTCKSITIFGQKIDDSGIGQKISRAIQNNSFYFDSTRGRIEKNVEEFAEINMLFMKHEIKGSKQYMTIRIEEKKKGKSNLHTIFEETIKMKEHIY